MWGYIYFTDLYILAKQFFFLDADLSFFFEHRKKSICAAFSVDAAGPENLIPFFMALLVLSCCGSYIFFNFKPYVTHSPISMFLSITTQSQHRLNSVSSQCAHGKSSLARKSEVHPNFF